MVAIAPVPGPAGPSGPAGPVGPPGPSGAGDLTYLHTQLTPASQWTIDHNLGKEPTVTVIDSAGSEVVGDVNYTNTNRVVITFSSAFAGRARLN